VPQVSLLRPGIPQTNSYWKHPPSALSLEATQISCFTALTSDHLCGSPKENHMLLTEAATLDRKSGEADLSRRAVEGSAVPRTSPGNA
jgi:hypothetical protein